MTDIRAPTGRSWLGRLQIAHLHDYGRGAVRFWSCLVVLGITAVASAVFQLIFLPVAELLQILAFVAIAALAAAFPVQIPRTKHSIAAGDSLVFLVLGVYGPAAAVLAAALEALVAAIRSSARLSSRLASLSAAAIAMSIAGAVFPLVEHALAASHLYAPAAHLAALTIAVVVYFVISTCSLMQIVCLKRGERLHLSSWFDATAWLGALYLGSAMLAGLLSLNTAVFGRAVTAVVIMSIAASVALLRAHFRRRIVEDDAQEARVAAAELEAEQNRKRFHSAFTQASIGMAIVSSEGIIVQANDALATLLACSSRDMVGRPFRSLLHAGDATLLDRQLAEIIERRADTFSIELRCAMAGNREAWVSLHCARFDDDGGADHGLILQLHDITSRRRAEGELRHIAYHDSLTDLANRNCFQERLEVVLARRGADKPPFAVMYLDIDRFKLVNDTLGHPAGDELLQEVARRLNACVRPNDLVARLGGDEFAILLEDARDETRVVAMGQRLLSRLDEPCWINGTELRPQASIGATLSKFGYKDADSMLRDADLAMYEAKANGKGQLALFDEKLHAQLGHKLRLQSDLRRALEWGELSLAFQPLCDLAQERVIGCEALARWRHPVHGDISPAQFVALAEETGSIEALTKWAIAEALRQLGEWRRQYAHARQQFSVHVNVSGKNLSRAGLVEHVRTTLKRYEVPPHQLVLEITESTVMAHREAALESLEALRELGVKVSIDDFGTGYSSLSYLTTLPFDCLKIDRSFVAGMEVDPHNVEIVRTVLSLGRALNKVVIAEGIETTHQAALLRAIGVTVGQGFLLGRPMDAVQLQAAISRAGQHRLEPEQEARVLAA